MSLFSTIYSLLIAVKMHNDMGMGLSEAGAELLGMDDMIFYELEQLIYGLSLIDTKGPQIVSHLAFG